MGSSLRRTESYISCAPLHRSSSPPPPRKLPTTTNESGSLVPYHRTLQYYKDQRDKRKAQLSRAIDHPITIRITSTPTTTTTRPPTRHLPQPPKIQPQPSTPPLPSSSSSSSPPPPSSSSPSSPPTPRRLPPTPTLPTVYHTPPRRTSPLAPTRAARPGRPLFPRSKPEPDLYRKAIKACMQASPEGQKILRMGPRLALSIMSATKELERIVAAQNEREKEEMLDVVMFDATVGTGPVSPVLTKSWVFVPGNEDWEMVDCAA